MENFWEDKFNVLAIYNAEKSRGILHTEKYKGEMENLQKEYNRKIMRGLTLDDNFT